MADQLGKLRARLEADSSGFTAGIKRAQADVKGFGGMMQSTLGSLKGMIGGLGAALAGMASAAAIKGALDDLDRIGKLSQITGAATADLQKLSFAARQSGVDIEMIAKSSRKMHEALRESPDLFAGLGLSAAKLLTLDMPSQLGMIGDALNQVGDAQDRAALAMKIFGKQGAELLPFLAGGMAEIAGKAAELEAMGGVFSDEDIARATAAGDALDKAGRSLKIMTTELAITFAPTIEFLAGLVAKLSSVFQTLQGWSGALGRWAGRGIEAVMDTGYDALRAAKAADQRLFASRTDYHGNDTTRYFQRVTESVESMATNISTPTW